MDVQMAFPRVTIPPRRRAVIRWSLRCPRDRSGSNLMVTGVVCFYFPAGDRRGPTLYQIKKQPPSLPEPIFLCCSRGCNAHKSPVEPAGILLSRTLRCKCAGCWKGVLLPKALRINKTRRAGSTNVSAGMATFTLVGPVIIPVVVGRAGGPSVDRTRLGAFWAESDCGDRTGCYVFGIRTGRGTLPYYAGRTTNSFENDASPQTS
jgi:hypothetical protein